MLNYTNLNKEQKICFLVEICHRLTVQARNAYLIDDNYPRKYDMLKYYNEVQHHILNMIKDLVMNTLTYNDSDFLTGLIQILNEKDKGLVLNISSHYKSTT